MAVFVVAPDGCVVVGLDGHSSGQNSCCNVLHIIGPLQIPHLIELGINAVELLPLFEYDELEFQRMYARASGERIQGALGRRQRRKQPAWFEIIC